MLEVNPFTNTEPYDPSRALYTLPPSHPQPCHPYHSTLTSSSFAQVRQRDLGAARRLLGQGVGYTGKLGKEKVFKDYIHLERQLGEVDRCRSLFHK